MKQDTVGILNYLKKNFFYMISFPVFLLMLSDIAYPQPYGGQGGLRLVPKSDRNESILKPSMIETFNYTIEMFPSQHFKGAWYYWSFKGHQVANFKSTQKDVKWLSFTPHTFSSDSCSDIVQVNYQFDSPDSVGKYVDTVVDFNGNWQNTIITLWVTNSPSAYGPYDGSPVNAGANSDTVSHTFYNLSSTLSCVDHYSPADSIYFDFFVNPSVSWMKIEGQSAVYEVLISKDDSVNVRYVLSNDTTGGWFAYLTEYTQGYYSDPIYYLFLHFSTLSSVHDFTGNGIPGRFDLQQNFPNPFNPNTVIQFLIPEESFVTIKVYDILGKEITTLVNERKPAGNYSVNFNGRDLPSGVYFYRMQAVPEGRQAGSFVSTKKFILLK